MGREKEVPMSVLNRRDFMNRSALTGLGVGIAASGFIRPALAYPHPDKDAVSLATWSIVRSFRAGVWKLTDIHRICREDFQLDGVEYVTAFFEAPVAGYLDRLNKAAEDYGVRNVLIMVDNEGPMVAKDRKARMQAAVNHRKWVDVAAYLGCHAIRCNALGGEATFEQDPESLDRAAESFGALIEYAKDSRINILIENHGGLSSDPEWLPALMKKVNSPHFGILPDYGNYLPGSDIAQAVRTAMPHAKGVSVKAAWSPDGSHPAYDLENLIRISKDSGFSGFWGIESSMRRSVEDRPSSPEDIKEDEWQAVLWTKQAIQRVVFA
jgi:L-ribulose-5-phosphate 3-epimerase